MIAGLIAFLQLLPRLIDLMNRLGNWMIKNKFDKWMDDLEGTIDQLEKAATAQEKLNAAQGLVDSISKLGS